MPPMKIQPIDSQTYLESSIRADTAKPVLKSRFKRLFDRQFPVKKPAVSGEGQYGKDAELFEPSSVCLAKMVQNFIEESNDKAQKCGRSRCNCFNGNSNDSSDDDFDGNASGFGDSVPTAWYGDFCDTIKSLIQCASVVERNLLADTSKLVEKNKICKRKDHLIALVADELVLLGYNASVCKSRWEKTPSYPAGEYEYIDVICEEGDGVIIDIDFKSEFEIARPTTNYKTIIQSLPYIFVGKADRLQQIVSIISEAAKHSLKKNGMHIPPWRKAEYMKAKWLSPPSRAVAPPPCAAVEDTAELLVADKYKQCDVECDCGKLDLIFGEIASSLPENSPAAKVPWQPPPVKPKSRDKSGKAVVTGLASLFKERA